MGGRLIVEFSQYWFGNKVNVFMDDFCLERRSALMRCADESKLGDIIARGESECQVRRNEWLLGTG